MECQESKNERVNGDGRVNSASSGTILQAVSGCRRRANAHRQSVRQTAIKEAVRLKSMVPPKQETLLSTASEKGVSTWLTADPLTSHGTVLNKSDFRDAVCLRYGYELDGLSSRCVCGQEMSHDHALSCPTGGYPSACHNEIRDILAETLQSIAHDVEIEPVLLPFEGENLPGRTANRSTAARLDIRARSFWTRQQDAFFDVRVTNPKAHLHSASEVQHHLLSHEQQKKRQYGLRVTTIDRGSFTPLVFATNGMVGKECERFLKTLVGRVVEKNGDLRYSVVMNHLRTKLTMSILRWNITCFRGCRSSYTRKKSSLFVTQCRLLCLK